MPTSRVATRSPLQHNNEPQQSISVCCTGEGDGATQPVVGYHEKPTSRHAVSMGIYVVNPSLLRLIEPGVYLDFPDLVLNALAEGERVGVVSSRRALARHRSSRRLRARGHRIQRRRRIAAPRGRASRIVNAGAAPDSHVPSPGVMPERPERGDARITFRRRGLVIGESYFSEPADQFPRHLDVLRVVAAATPPAGRRRSNEAHTLAIELLRDEDRLFADISSDTRRKIRRATDKDRVETIADVAPSGAGVSAFADAYDRFASARSLAPIFRPRLLALASTGHLTLTVARAPEGRELVRHAYVGARAHAHLMYSASLLPDATHSEERNLIGRANRLLHWRDIQHFQETSTMTCSTSAGSMCWVAPKRPLGLPTSTHLQRHPHADPLVVGTALGEGIARPPCATRSR